MTLDEYEKLIPNAKVEGLTFLTPNQQCAWRVQTLYTKEPDTIAWIRGMKEGEILYDVGANMGQYSMLAAKQGLTVHAFEPESQNFALLTRNIAINNEILGGRCTPWPIAISDHESTEILHLSAMLPGSSCHSYGNSTNFKGEAVEFPYFQGSIATTLDKFSARWRPPTHIKIDVDGFEHLVIRGANVVLNRARSVLIEINTRYPAHMEYILPRMAELGFEYDAAQAESSRRKAGPFEGVGNIIFYRDN